MKFYLVLKIFLSLLLPIEIQASRPTQLNSVCEKFTAGEIDALSTLEALDLNIDDYSLGIYNTAKMFCA
tara:strand:+ start:39 stop:245 length:207 start_codon:yes stop_codon:yes gene_type:complete